jgi:plastocyanin
MRTWALVAVGVLAGLVLGLGLLGAGWTFMHGGQLAADYRNAPAPGAYGPMGGMMGRGGTGGMGGMMGRPGDVAGPTAAPDDNRQVDATVNIVAQNLAFTPARVTVKAGQTVRFMLENRDGFAHNFVSPQAGIGERIMAAGSTTTLVWTAPATPGAYRALCTYHPGMVVLIDVQ